MSDSTNGATGNGATGSTGADTAGDAVKAAAQNPAANPATSTVGAVSASDLIPTPHARIKKAKRTRAVLVLVIILLIGALGGLAWIGYTILTEQTATVPASIKPGDTLVGGEVTDPDAPGEVKVDETSIPALASLFGLTVEEVKTKLDPGFQLTKTDSVTDETNPAIRQLATFSYTPSVSGAAPGALPNAALPSESIYASLDEAGKVIDIYYICDMRLLGYPEKSFDELLADSNLVSEALASAGVQPRDFNYAPPDPEASTVYDNPNSQNRKVVKQTHIFSGRTTSDVVPTVWTLTVTYDFGAGVASSSEFREATRTINLKLA
ncbi:MAG: hypothetical protein LBP24_01130 [Coriobacteriales bacterium]|jgi:hypothetical protein|nr:hypothetical protein [Coriobacteriales bacterium]